MKRLDRFPWLEPGGGGCVDGFMWSNHAGGHYITAEFQCHNEVLRCELELTGINNINSQFTGSDVCVISLTHSDHHQGQRETAHLLNKHSQFEGLERNRLEHSRILYEKSTRFISSSSGGFTT